MLAALVMRAQGLARLVSRLEGVVEAGLTEYADVIDVADEVARISPRPRRVARSSDARDPEPRGRRSVSSRSSSRTGSSSPATTTGRDPGHRIAGRDRGARDRSRHRASRRTRSNGSSSRSSRPRSCTPGPIRAWGSASPSRGCRPGRWTATSRSSRRARRVRVPLAGLDESFRRRPVGRRPHSRRAEPAPYLKRRMCTFSRIPTPRQLASIELPRTTGTGAGSP